MKPYVFNPFGIFEKEWGQRILPWSVILILASLFVISVLDPIFPAIQDFARDRHIYVIGILGFLLTSAPLVFNWLARLSRSSHEENVQLRSTEDDAINSMLGKTRGHHLEKLDICCYTGSTFLAVLSKSQFSKDFVSMARVLIRHPGVPFRVPHDLERAQAMRQRIITNLNLYQQILEPVSESIEIRGYSCEPSLRSMVMNRSKGFFTFYTTSNRLTSGRTTPDYVARGKPVFEFSVDSSLGRSIMNTIESRFEDIWKISCPLLPRPTLIFDFDGTLFNSIEYHKKAWDIVLSDIGIREGDYRFKKVHRGVEMGLSTPEVLESVSIGASNKEEIVKQKRRVYERIILDENCQFHPDVIGTVTQLHDRHYQLAIATIAGKSLVEKLLEQFAIKDYFSTIVCREDVQRVKPEPDVIFKVCQLLDTQPDSTVMIGDSVADHNAALKAGSCFIPVLRNYEIGRFKLASDIRPFEIIGSLSRLLNLFF